MSALAKQPLTRWMEILGLALIVVAVAWWGIVYAQVMNNTGFPFHRTLPCLLQTTDRCSLAMSLCKDWHVLGIKRYSAGLIWAGAGISLAALALGSLTSSPSGRKGR